MFYVWLMYVLLGLFLVAVPVQREEPRREVRVEGFVRRDCGRERVRCFDACEFLCTDATARCISNVCVDGEDAPAVDCVHGMVTLTEERGFREWKCVCHDPNLFLGKDCGRLAPDVCERGTFLYAERECVCHDPYHKVVVHGKPHCLEEEKARFFR